MRREKRKILSVITKWLIIAVCAACLFSVICSYLLLSVQIKKGALRFVTSNAMDMVKDLHENADQLILNLYLEDFQGAVMSDFLGQEDVSRWLDNEAGVYNEMSVISKNGLIVDSTVKSVCGENVFENDSENLRAAAEVSKVLTTEETLPDNPNGGVFICADSVVPKKSLDGEKEYRYYGQTFEDYGGLILLGIAEDEFIYDIRCAGETVANNRHVGSSGYMLIVDRVEGWITSGLNGYYEYHSTFPYPELLTEADNSPLVENVSFKGDLQIDEASIPVHYINGVAELYGEPSYYAIARLEDTYVVTMYPKSEAERSLYSTLLYIVIMEILVFAVLLCQLLYLEKRLVIKDIHRINATLNAITKGNLDERADVRSTYEFNALSDDINSTVDRLKELISEAEKRMDEDLAIAREIQTSALPNVFPPFPDRKEFELFASMHAAREVGGDFYDFFMLKGDKLGFLVADVSGKSIPGAMFMMTSKSVIKSLAESGLSPAEVFDQANRKLCEGNDAEMFLTAWMGYLDLKSGVVKAANAGHNPPVLIRDGKAGYVKLKSDLVLACMKDMTYNEHSVELKKGDILYLYTDGVTEAMDPDGKMYGEERLIQLLSFGENYPESTGDNGITEAVCRMVTADIEKFVKGAEQSDDITMLCIRYLG